MGSLNDEGQPHGEGTMSWNGTTYTGRWSNGRLDEGEMISLDGKYTGFFQNNTMHGHGVFTFHDAKFDDDIKKYEGCFEKNVFWGEGTITFADGTVVSGLFEDDDPKKDAIFTCTYPNRAVYTGTISNDFKRNGRGKTTYPFLHKISSFDGVYKDDKKVEGECVYKNGIIHEGFWKDNGREFCLHGKGKEILRDRTTYTGIWEDGVKHGNGEERFANGNVYIGKWVHGQKYGWFDQFKINGQKQEIHFLNGIFQP